MALFQRVQRFAPLAVVAFLGMLGACKPAEGPVRIGVAGAFSDTTGAFMKRAAELAAEEINAGGGIGGRPLQLIFRDDYGDPDSATFIAEELYISDVSAVVGHLFSNTTLAAAPVYNGGATPLVAISPSASSSEITRAGDHTFRVCPSDDVHGAVLARWAYHRLGLRRGAVLYLNDQYGRSIRQAFVDEFSRLDGKLVSVDPYLGSIPQVGPYLDLMVARERPDFLLIAGNRGDAEIIIREARRRGLTMPILGGNGLAGIEQAGTAVEDVLYSSAYFAAPTTPANRTFLASYSRRFPESSAPNQTAAATYDAIYLLSEVIARVGSERKAVHAALAAVGSATAPFDGVTGAIAFDANGDLTNRQVHVGLVRHGAVAVQEIR